jgi:hypothetical protein
MAVPVSRFDFLTRRRLTLDDLGRHVTPAWQGLAVGSAIAALLVIGCYALAEVRVRSALEVEDRAEARLAASDAVRRRAAVEWSDVRGSMRRARQLRDIRLSGSFAVQRLTRIGNALPDSVWLNGFSNGTSDYDIRGETTGIDALATAFDVIAAQTERTGVSFTRHSGGTGALLQFEVRPAQDR